MTITYIKHNLMHILLFFAVKPTESDRDMLWP